MGHVLPPPIPKPGGSQGVGRAGDIECMSSRQKPLTIDVRFHRVIMIIGIWGAGILIPG